jgi:CHASE2 domain-containing sensor protein
MIKYLFKKDTILATLMVFIVMGLLALIPVNTHVLDPVKMALQDFDYNDLAYSQFKKNEHTSLDTGMVIINIGTAAREEISAMIEKAATENPLVVGVDVLFNEPKDSATDSSLQTSFFTTGKIVLAYTVTTQSGKTAAQGFMFEKAKQKGYANFVGEEGGAIRFFAPVIKNEKEDFQSFAAAVARVAYPAAYEKMMTRHNITEQINYTRTPEKFMLVDGIDYIKNKEAGLSLKNKVVLIGYVSPDIHNVEDKHFTPLNKKSVGKTIPDMEGLFIHANIISMIKEGNFVKKIPVWLNWLIASLLCWFHMSLFIRYFLDRHIWFHLVAKIAQVLSAVLFVYLGLLFYYNWDIKINLTPTFVAIILAVDVLYFYEAMVSWLHKTFGYQSIFINSHPH